MAQTFPPVFSRLGLWLGIVALAGYAFFLARHASVAAGGSDTSGYLNSARLLAEGRLQNDWRIPAEFGPAEQLSRDHFMPLGFAAIAGNSQLPPTYPVGMPLHLALAGRFLGWETGTLVVELALALGALLLCYAVAREFGLEPVFAAAPPIALAAFPVFIFTSIQPLSDTAATTWCLLAVWTAIRSKKHAAWALACGAAVGMAVLIRATNVLILPALVALIAPDWRRLGLAALGGLPAALWLAYYNHALYGSALVSGYGPIWDAFGWSYGWKTAKHFAYWIAALITPLALALPLLALRAMPKRDLLALGLWFGAFVGVYAFYEVSHQTWWCLRFILPGIPALLILAMLGASALRQRIALALAAVFATWAIAAAAISNGRLHPLLIREYEALYPAVCARIAELVPPQALLVSHAGTGAIFHYTEFPILRWDQLTAEEFARYAALATDARRPIYAVLWGGFEDDARARIGGEWELVSAVKNVQILRYLPPQR